MRKIFLTDCSEKSRFDRPVKNLRPDQTGPGQTGRLSVPVAILVCIRRTLDMRSG